MRRNNYEGLRMMQAHDEWRIDNDNSGYWGDGSGDAFMWGDMTRPSTFAADAGTVGNQFPVRHVAAPVGEPVQAWDTAQRLSVLYEAFRDKDVFKRGQEWYAEQGKWVRDMAALRNTTPEIAAGVTAALSPRQRWYSNKWKADALLGGDLRRYGLDSSHDKAMAIKGGAPPLSVLGGPKTRAFHQALLGDMNAVVLDVWMLRALGWHRNSVTPKQYDKLAAVVRAAAALTGTTPAQFQATIWCIVRGYAY